VVTMAKRAATIVRDLRNFISQGNIERQTLNLNEVIGQAVQLVAAEARNKGMTLKTELTSEMPLIAGDFIQLEQLMLNLILNGMEAIEATGMRQGELTLRTVTAGNRQVELSVQDTGIGLSPEVEARLFEAFVTTKPDGLGMGLSIGRTIVEAHGGRIWATSNPDRGTTFHVAFPMASHEHPGDP
jgi:two-component system sensor kinase FixL